MPNIKNHEYELDGVKVVERTHINNGVGSTVIFKEGSPNNAVRERNYPYDKRNLRRVRERIGKQFIQEQRKRDGRDGPRRK